MNAIAMRGLADVTALAETQQWKPFHAGIDCVPIYETPDNGPAAMLLRYQPGAQAPVHVHEGHEHILILSGSQIDERGHHPVGSLLIHPPGTEHHVRSDEGCIVLAIWERRVRFIEDEMS
ncbi:MAG: cupin domain-containing protein [Panacagrimonas sp.]